VSAPRGGRRRGAGRPPEYIEPMVRVTITLPQSYLEPLRREGHGFLSEGIRFVIEEARTPGGYYWFAFGRENPPPGPLFPRKSVKVDANTDPAT
jgi:hypothetical protein